MSYKIRPATIADIPHIVSHREQMFRDMGIPAEFEDMAGHGFVAWSRPPVARLSRLDGDGPNGDIAGGGGLLVIPWPPGPITLDRGAGRFNVYTLPAHRDRVLRGS